MCEHLGADDEHEADESSGLMTSEEDYGHGRNDKDSVHQNSPRLPEHHSRKDDANEVATREKYIDA